MNQYSKENLDLRAAKKRVKDLKGFYTHLVVYVVINLFIIAVQIKGEPVWEALSQPENYYTAFFWGIGVLAHALTIFGPSFFLGKDWEERKIKELMEKEKRQKWE